MKILRLGVVGYCPPTKFDEKKALAFLQEAYNTVEEDFLNYKIIVVSGLTNVGTIKLAYEEAKKRDWKTAGVACKKAFNYKNLFPIDEKPVIVGENWGDESETFVNSIDALIRIGGGPQSLRETELARKKGKKIYEYDLPKF